MNLNQRHEADDDPPVPARLGGALAKLTQRRIAVPPRVDEAVLAKARRHLRKMRKPEPVQPAINFWAAIVRAVEEWLDRCVPRWRPVAPWAAVAAVLVAAALIARVVLQPGTPDLGNLAREDLNSDGRVDVLDAFALARQLKQGGSPNRHLDLNGDGAVDQRDVQLLAAHAVSLERSQHL